MPEPGRLFCSRPFTWFEVTQVRAKGDVYVCCPSWIRRSIGNLSDASVEEVWNGEAARAIRASILDGSFRYCDRNACPFLQTESGAVSRASDVRDPELRRVIDEGLTKLPFGPREINCCYDRSCNLSCPSCRTDLIMETENGPAILAIQEKLRTEALGEARVLYVTGSGDPFGSPYFRRFLQTLSPADVPRLERIHLHSNGLLWTDRVWETISPEIRALIRTAEISIDAACAATYAVNRRGGDFARLLANLGFIAGLRRDGPLEKLDVSMVVQANNFREMPAFVELGRRFGADTVYFSRLTNWGTFSPAEMAERAVHVPAHPRHAELVAVLGDPALSDPRVYLGNLTELRRAAA